MSQHPAPPYAAPGRPRPRRRWFVVGGVLLALAAVVFVVGLVTTVGRGTDTDVVALLRGPGQPVGAGVPVDEERMLFVPRGEPAPQCRVTDAEGRDVPVRPTTVGTTVTTMGVTWTGVSTFTSPTAEVRVECATPVDRLRIGSPLGAGFAVGLVLTILGPLLLGGAGLAVLVVTTVLWLSRPPRPAGSPPPPSSPSPGW
ncbi:hypothetical protein [Marmoricola sp. Leaf446]|uniref:hypothetical protein n=1 Tax=Marmoricola sp. Leaf446 TaxID=1736379 RepID=UPI0012E3C172|nr:hypothetical protein [Marmoricola sp. Leaf446]